MSDKLRVAVAGTGYFSQFHFDAWARCPEVEVVGVADLDIVSARSRASSAGAKAYSDVETMLEVTKPDLLDIITPSHTHPKMIELGAAAGVNMVCQKPFCGDLKTARHCVSIAEEAGVDLIVHENFRFQPWYREARKFLDNGGLGELYQITMRLRPGDGQGAQAYLARQPYFQKMERFLVHETAVHLVDVARYLIGPVESVWADLRRHNPVIAGEDAGIVVLSFGGNVRGIIDGNRNSDHVAENRRRTMGEMVIEGENGVLELDGDGALTFRAQGENTKQPVAFDWSDQGFGGDCVFNFTRHVVAHYCDGAVLENRAADYLVNLKIEEAVYQSAQDGVKRELGADGN